jgi:hypothetical protein
MIQKREAEVASLWKRFVSINLISRIPSSPDR